MNKPESLWVRLNAFESVLRAIDGVWKRKKGNNEGVWWSMSKIGFSMRAYDSIWAWLKVYKRVWLSMMAYDCDWANMSATDSTMSVYVGHWTPMKAYEPAWRSVKAYERLYWGRVWTPYDAWSSASVWTYAWMRVPYHSRTIKKDLTERKIFFAENLHDSDFHHTFATDFSLISPLRFMNWNWGIWLRR